MASVYVRTSNLCETFYLELKKMKKLIYLFIAASSLGMTAAAQNPNDIKARNLYFEALDEFDSKKYQNALNTIAKVEKLLGGKSNARLYYLTAKANFNLGNYDAASAACRNYFVSIPRQDPGYDEMLGLSSSLEAISIAAQKKIAEEAEQRKIAEAERIKREQEEAIAAEARRAKEAARRAEDAKQQLVLDKVEADDFKMAQQTNTQDAYQQFLYNHPYGKLTEKAEKEMARKWPTPVRAFKKNKYGFVDKVGSSKFVIKAAYDQATDFKEGLARVSKGGKYGFINTNGDVVVPIKYAVASNYSYGFAAVKDGNAAYFVDKTGKMLTEETYMDTKAFSEGLAAAQDQYFKYGFINTKGEVVIPFEYSAVSWFKEGIVAVGMNENGKMRYAYVNKNGERLTDFLYEEAKDFQNGVGRVKLEGKYGLVDKFGASITCCEYDYISEFKQDGYALAKKNGHDVLLDKEGVAWVKVNGVMVKVKF